MKGYLLERLREKKLKRKEKMRCKNIIIISVNT